MFSITKGPFLLVVSSIDNSAAQKLYLRASRADNVLKNNWYMCEYGAARKVDETQYLTRFGYAYIPGEQQQ